MKDNDKVMAAAFSVVWALVVFVVYGYVAIFKHRDCVTRQECHEIVDSGLTQIYD